MTKQQRITDLERRLTSLEQTKELAEWVLIWCGVAMPVLVLLWVFL